MSGCRIHNDDQQEEDSTHAKDDTSCGRIVLIWPSGWRVDPLRCHAASSFQISNENSLPDWIKYSPGPTYSSPLLSSGTAPAARCRDLGAYAGLILPGVRRRLSHQRRVPEAVLGSFHLQRTKIQFIDHFLVFQQSLKSAALEFPVL